MTSPRETVGRRFPMTWLRLGQAKAGPADSREFELQAGRVLSPATARAKVAEHDCRRQMNGVRFGDGLSEKPRDSWGTP